jgi:hypothetical protein
MAVTGEPTQVPFTGSPIQIWSGTGEAINILMFNQDQNNTVTVNYRNDVQVGASNAVPIGPQSSVTMDGSRTLYANAPNGTAAMIVIPGGGNFFQRLVSLTIPTGATTGARVVINGATGTITGYNAANQVTFVLSPTGLIVGPSSGTQIELTESGAEGLIEFLLNSGVLNNGSIEGQTPVAGFGTIISTGPQSTDPGYTDYVQTIMASAEPTIPAPAYYDIVYFDANGVSHVALQVSDSGIVINTASVTGIMPGTGTTPTNPAVNETWHAISLVGGPPAIAGYARVKQLAQANFICLDIQVSFTALVADATYTIGVLPSAAYYPIVARGVAGAPGGTVTNANSARAFIPLASGGIQLILPVGASSFSCSAAVPLD